MTLSESSKFFGILVSVFYRREVNVQLSPFHYHAEDCQSESVYLCETELQEMSAVFGPVLARQTGMFTLYVIYNLVLIFKICLLFVLCFGFWFLISGP